ncbi:hypothetical protein A4G18_06945 [Pasteurellaceae bacterium Pebbles2]|nr:hypothetical protein [Pasteurellaceae bacterium Pebbles2]
MFHFKKLTLCTAVLALSNVAVAAENDIYDGRWFVGGGVNLSKFEADDYTYGISDGSFKPGLEALGGYSFTFSDKFVGMVEAKLRLNNSKASNFGEDLYKEQYHFSVSYLQGYKVTEDFMPYAKLGAGYTKYDIDPTIKVNRNTAGSVVVGLGAKYKIAPNLLMGAEYTYGYSGNNSTNVIEFRTYTVGLNVSYHF